MQTSARLQKALGYQFQDPDLLALALTHCSAGKPNNERLEFLGDAVLSFVIASALYQRFPSAKEGEMSRMRAALVKGDTLALVAKSLELGDSLKLGAGERRSGGHKRDSILADALEALIGAVLLDGGVDHCRDFVLQHFASRLDELHPKSSRKDPKTRLQEYLQGRGWPLPKYKMMKVTGDPHEQAFTVSCLLREPKREFEGCGSSRRKAEQAAATAALQHIETQRE